MDIRITGNRFNNASVPFQARPKRQPDLDLIEQVRANPADHDVHKTLAHWRQEIETAVVGPTSTTKGANAVVEPIPHGYKLTFYTNFKQRQGPTKSAPPLVIPRDTVADVMKANHVIQSDRKLNRVLEDLPSDKVADFLAVDAKKRFEMAKYFVTSDPREAQGFVDEVAAIEKAKKDGSAEIDKMSLSPTFVRQRDRKGSVTTERVANKVFEMTRSRDGWEIKRMDLAKKDFVQDPFGRPVGIDEWRLKYDGISELDIDVHKGDALKTETFRYDKGAEQYFYKRAEETTHLNRPGLDRETDRRVTAEPVIDLAEDVMSDLQSKVDSARHAFKILTWEQKKAAAPVSHA